MLSWRSRCLVAWFSGHDVVKFVVCQLIAGRFQDGDAFSVLYQRGVTQEILSMVTRLNRGGNNRGAYLIEAARGEVGLFHPSIGLLTRQHNNVSTVALGPSNRSVVSGDCLTTS